VLSASDEGFLKAAIKLAEAGLFTTTPNPRVGCLLVKDGRVIGRGWHERHGGPHAEVVALNAAEASPEGATCYVSLEPCAFVGRTPPCTDALIAARVGRVVAAMRDPHPNVAGKGFELLEAAGIATDCAEVPAARDLNVGYCARIERGRPWVRIKVAASLDGRTAMASGESQWITGAEARADVQYWRARSCAVVTGIGTVLADDPQLNVREGRFRRGGSIRQPLRVVCDSGLRTPATSALFSTPEPVLIVTTAEGKHPKAEVLATRGARARDGASVDLGAMLENLAGRGCNEVLIEAGPTLTGAVLAAGLWDEALIYLAPKLLGSTARPLAEMALETLSDGVEMELADVSRVGPDLRLRVLKRG
jgi:diaminohydroxyphosphoribosylaminopyrimidine deaminase/5-amino-6-(5-phosphoribosylamino)uracil reductase